MRAPARPSSVLRRLGGRALLVHTVALPARQLRMAHLKCGGIVFAVNWGSAPGIYRRKVNINRVAGLHDSLAPMDCTTFSFSAKTREIGHLKDDVYSGTSKTFGVSPFQAENTAMASSKIDGTMRTFRKRNFSHHAGSGSIARAPRDRGVFGKRLGGTVRHSWMGMVGGGWCAPKSYCSGKKV